MKTFDAWQEYQNQNPLSPYTIANMQDTFEKLAKFYPELPKSAFKINTFLTALSKEPYSLAATTVHMHRRHIVSLLKFLNTQMNFPDYVNKIIKISIPKSKRRYFSNLELHKIYFATKTPLEKALLYTFMYSPCREGELGRHPTKTGIDYPGLRVEMMSEPFQITDPISNLPITVCNLNVQGKKGPVTYHLDPEIRQMLLSIASPNGEVFTTTASPNGMTSKAIQCMIRELVIRAGITGNKLGPHSFRHTAASIIAKKTGSVLAVMAGIQDSETKSAMVYIHDVEDELKHTASVSSIIKNEIFGKAKEPIQANLLTAGDQTDSTALVSFTETPVEQVNGEIDLSEELFKQIPEEEIKPIRAVLTTKRLIAMRKAFIYYAKHEPFDGLAGELSQMMKDFFRKR